MNTLRLRFFSLIEGESYKKGLHELTKPCTQEGMEASQEQNSHGVAQPQRLQVQVTKLLAASPRAPAVAQERASSLMAVMRTAVEGATLSKMIAFRCLQSDQAVRAAMVARPRRREAGVRSMAAESQVY